MYHLIQLDWQVPLRIKVRIASIIKIFLKGHTIIWCSGKLLNWRSRFLMKNYQIKIISCTIALCGFWSICNHQIKNLPMHSDDWFTKFNARQVKIPTIYTVFQSFTQINLNVSCWLVNLNLYYSFMEFRWFQSFNLLIYVANISVF